VGPPGTIRVGDQIRVNGPDGPVLGFVTAVQHTYMNGRDSGVVNFRPVTMERPLSEPGFPVPEPGFFPFDPNDPVAVIQDLTTPPSSGTNPCAEIPLGRPPASDGQAWSELEIATLRNILGDDIDLRPGSLVRTLLEVGQRGIDMHELTRQLKPFKDAEERAAKLAELLKPYRTRFERDPVI